MSLRARWGRGALRGPEVPEGKETTDRHRHYDLIQSSLEQARKAPRSWHISIFHEQEQTPSALGFESQDCFLVLHHLLAWTRTSSRLLILEDADSSSYRVCEASGIMIREAFSMQNA